MPYIPDYMSERSSIKESYIKLQDGYLDAFGRMRVSFPESVFDSKLVREQDESLYFDTSTATSGTVEFLANNACVNLTVTGTSGSIAIRQTREYFSYQPGKSSLVFITAVVGALKTNVRQRVGFFDANNGFFYEQDGVNRKVVIRSNASGTPVDNAINQSDWNIDKMNGAGISGILLDPSKNMILVLDFQYLGVGRVRFGFDINGYIYYCHEFVHANETSGVYMSSPNLPVRWEIVATGTASGNTTLKAICCCVISEGGHNPKGLVFNHNLGNTPKSASQGVRVPVVSLRLKPTFNRVPVLPLKSDTMSTGNQNCLMEYWLLRAGGTASLTSATFSISPHTQSSVNIDIDATSLTIGDAVRIGSDYISSVSKDSEIILSNYKVLSNIAGTSDILCITAMGIGGNATGVHNSLTWLEEF